MYSRTRPHSDLMLTGAEGRLILSNQNQDVSAVSTSHVSPAMRDGFQIEARRGRHCQGIAAVLLFENSLPAADYLDRLLLSMTYVS